MKIIILCHNLYVAGGLNVGLNFARTLKEVAPADKFLVIAPPERGYEDVDLPAGSDIFVYSGGSNLFNRWLFDCHQLPNLIKRWSPDVILGLGNLGVTLTSYKQAILFAESHLVYPSRHYAKETRKARALKWLLKQRLKRCLAYTDLLFCQTPVAKERFAHVFGYPPGRIRIMSKAVSEFSKISREQAGVPEVFAKKGYYNLFYLTKFYAHKNLEILIDIFRKYSEELKDIRCIVTIAADQHANAGKFLNDISKYNLEEHIVNVGPLKENDLAGYFYNSDALFFPSVLESFSSTHLEAMHFGLPILTGDLDFSHYVCDDAALYFNPWDAKDVTDKILTLKNNPKLAEELTRKGKERVSTFFKSWSEIAAEAMKELRLLVNQQ